MKPVKIKLIVFLLILFANVSTICAQKFKSSSSYIHFFSDAPIEDIEAENLKSQSAFDLGSGKIVFSVPIDGFIFKKTLMQEHFNENYLESDKYPKAIFDGILENFDPQKRDWQSAIAKGKMTIHGVKNNLECEGKIKIDGNSIEIESKFPIQVADYKIKIPKVVFYNIAEIVDVTVKISYEKID